MQVRRLSRGGQAVHGYALVLALVIAMVISVMSMALVSTGNAELQGARFLTGRSEARDLAASSLEEFYANVQTVPGFLDALQDSDTSTWPAHLAFTPPSQRNTASAKWAKLDGITPVSCTKTDGSADYEANCYTLTAYYTDTGIGGQGRALLLDVTTRVRCGGVEQRCIYARYQQRLRQAQFYDYLFFYQFATLAPVLYPASDTDLALDCAERYGSRENQARAAVLGNGSPRGASCINVAYAGKVATDTNGIAQFVSKDVINGPVYTADDFISVCGNPEFQSSVSVAGAGSSGVPWRSVAAPPACPSTSATLVPADRRSVNAELLTLPPTGTVAEGAAAIADPAYVFSGDLVDIKLVTTGAGTAARTTLSVTGANEGNFTGLPLPSPPIVVVGGTATISGTLSGKLSVIVEDDLTITGDLVYEGGGTVSNTRDVLGLTAGGSIVIAQQEVPDAEMFVQGALLSLDSTIYVDGWDTPRWVSDTSNPKLPDWDGSILSTGEAPGNSDPNWVEFILPGYMQDCSYDEPVLDEEGFETGEFILIAKNCWEGTVNPAPTLRFFGAMASKYQGVFSGLDPSTGDILSGFAKDFTFDTRMTNSRLAPPYLVSPSAASWQRLEMVELPVDAL